MIAPPFELGGSLPLIAARALCVSALFGACGTLAVLVYVAPRALARLAQADAEPIVRRLETLARGTALAAVVALAVWLLLQAADIAGAQSVAAAFAAVPDVAFSTAFGHCLLLQGAAALAVATVLAPRAGRLIAPRRRHGLALILAVFATLLQAGHGHALAMHPGPSLLLACDAVHLLGAAVWLGGLPALFLMVALAPPRAGATAARWFSPLGKVCVAAVAGSALVQGWVLVGSLPGLAGTAYGWMILAKLALFGALLGFALVNRYRLAPALLGGHPAAARRALMRSIAVQTGFGLAAVVAAAVLTSLPPAMHEQPLWPFALRPSLATVAEDPGFLREVVGAALALAAAFALVLLALALRRWRVAACVAAGLVAWLAAPHLDLLLVEAYPTSFYRSPTGFAATGIADGAALYAQHCAACHGAGGAGDGPLARGLAIPPADLTAAHLWMHSDGELFWWLTHGIDNPEGGSAMPGFAADLSEDQRWALIDFIRARNAGLVQARTGDWLPPQQAPDFPVRCGGATHALHDYRGRFVRLVVGASPPPPEGGVATTILVVPPAVPAAGCQAADPSVLRAYEIMTGSPPGALIGGQVLIDDGGWLRAVQRPGAAPGWNAPGALAQVVRDLRAHPVAAQAGPVGMGGMGGMAM